MRSIDFYAHRNKATQNLSSIHRFRLHNLNISMKLKSLEPTRLKYFKNINVLVSLVAHMWHFSVFMFSVYL